MGSITLTRVNQPLSGPVNLGGLRYRTTTSKVAMFEQIVIAYDDSFGPRKAMHHQVGATSCL